MSDRKGLAALIREDFLALDNFVSGLKGIEPGYFSKIKEEVRRFRTAYADILPKR